MLLPQLCSFLATPLFTVVCREPRPPLITEGGSSLPKITDGPQPVHFSTTTTPASHLRSSADDLGATPLIQGYGWTAFEEMVEDDLLPETLELSTDALCTDSSSRCCNLVRSAARSLTRLTDFGDTAASSVVRPTKPGNEDNVFESLIAGK